MTKQDLVAELARARGARERDVLAVVNGFIRSIERALSEGRPVTLRGFGRFEVRPRARRRVRPPGRARAVEVPARLAPVFLGAPALARRLESRRGKGRRTR